MNFLVVIVRLMLYILIIPVLIISWIQYLYALAMYEKKTLTVSNRCTIGKHVIDNKTNSKYVVLWRSRINRAPCPDWYKLYVAIKPSK